MTTDLCTEQKLCNLNRITAILTALVILVSILYWQPFYGPMDDHAHVTNVVPKIMQGGFLPFFEEFVRNDFGWGMFRPTYAVMIGLLYAPAVLLDAPWLLFFLNAVFSFSILFFSAKVFGRILKVSYWKILVIEGAFFYGHDLFQHPSLQEKLVHLFGLLLLAEVDRRDRARFALVGLWSFLGFSAKASFVIYIGMAGWLLLFHDLSVPGISTLARRLWKKLPLFIAFGLGVLFLAWVARHGVYTSGRYSWQKILPNLLSLDGVMFVVPVIAAVALALFRARKPENAIELGELTAAVGTAAFLLLFLPWGIKGYLHTMAAPIFCALLAWLLDRILSTKLQQLMCIVFCISAVLVTTYRSTVNFSRLHDLGQVVKAAKDWPNVTEIWVACAEGSDALRNFFQLQGISSITVQELKDFSPANLDAKVIFYDQGLCPLPGRVPIPLGCTASFLFQGNFAKSYKVATLRCR